MFVQSQIPLCDSVSPLAQEMLKVAADFAQRCRPEGPFVVNVRRLATGLPACAAFAVNCRAGGLHPCRRSSRSGQRIEEQAVAGEW